MGFTVAIVGRPNVGKSTFFNRMMEERKAIVHDISGVTRDRQYGIADWNGKSFNVIDTGGFVPDSEDVFEREIRKQVAEFSLQVADGRFQISRVRSAVPLFPCFPVLSKACHFMRHVWLFQNLNLLFSQPE